MHFSTSKSTKGGMVVHMRHNTGGSVMLLSKIKNTPLPNSVMGGGIGANRIIGILQPPMPAPQNATMNTVGGSGIMNFSKHVKHSARNMKKKGKMRILILYIKR